MALLQGCEYNIYPIIHCSSAISANSDTHLTVLKQQAAAGAASQGMEPGTETLGCPAHPVSTWPTREIPHHPHSTPGHEHQTQFGTD